jgi:hypothetical protein
MLVLMGYAGLLFRKMFLKLPSQVKAKSKYEHSLLKEAAATRKSPVKASSMSSAQKTRKS